MTVLRILWESAWLSLFLFVLFAGLQSGGSVELAFGATGAVYEVVCIYRAACRLAA